MSRRDLMRLMAGAATLPAGASSTSAQASSYPMNLVDALGRSVTIQAPPLRAIALGHAPYGQLAALGVRPVGAFANPGFKAHTEYLFPDPDSIPSVVNLDWSPNAEIIAGLRPDAIFGWSFNEAQISEGIAPFFAIREFPSVESVQDNLRTLGRMLDRSAEADRAITRYDARRLAYRRRAGRAGSVLFVSGRSTKRFAVASGANAICRIADDFADCVSVSPPSRAVYVEMSLEGLLAIDPDSIVLGYFQLAQRAAYLAALSREPLWTELKAVRNGRVIVYDGYQDLSIRGLPTAARLLDLIVPRLHPERVPHALADADVLAETGG